MNEKSRRRKREGLRYTDVSIFLDLPIFMFRYLSVPMMFLIYYLQLVSLQSLLGREIRLHEINHFFLKELI